MFKTIVSILLLLVLLQGSLYAQPFFVWPGDANGNGVVNHVDLLELGLHYGHQGPARAFSSSSWFPHVLDTAWGIYSPSLVDLGHGDCNGDGQIDSLDAAVVGQNFGNYWQLANPGDGSTLDTLAAPSLQLNAPNPISLTQLDTVSVTVSLGNGSQAHSELYGLAFTIDFDPTIVDTVLLAFSGGWMNLDNTALIVQRMDSIPGRVHVGITRRDGLAVNGNGALGSLGIVMDDDIRISANYQIPFTISFARAIDAAGMPIALRPVGHVLDVTTPDPPGSPKVAKGIQVYPSPANSTLFLDADDLRDVHVRIIDLSGRVVYAQNFNALSHYPLSVLGWIPGVYFVEVVGKGSKSLTKVCIGLSD
jgi:hypothetical protein